MESFSQLTKREQEVLSLVAQGKQNKEITQLLGITQRVVEKHLSSIFQKLGVGNRVQATMLYWQSSFGNRSGGLN